MRINNLIEPLYLLLKEWWLYSFWAFSPPLFLTPFSWQLCTLDKHSSSLFFTPHCLPCISTSSCFSVLSLSYISFSQTCAKKNKTERDRKRETEMFIWSVRAALNSSLLWFYFRGMMGYIWSLLAIHISGVKNISSVEIMWAPFQSL